MPITGADGAACVGSRIDRGVATLLRRAQAGLSACPARTTRRDEALASGRPHRTTHSSCGAPGRLLARQPRGRRQPGSSGFGPGLRDPGPGAAEPLAQRPRARLSRLPGGALPGEG